MLLLKALRGFKLAAAWYVMGGSRGVAVGIWCMVQGGLSGRKGTGTWACGGC